MAISGGIKLLAKSYADIDYDGCLIGMTSGADSRLNMRDRRSFTYSESVGSNDATTETWTVTFDSTYSISRLLLAGNNFKDFDVKYWDGAAWAHFSSVVTKEGTQTNITETANAKGSNYYEFAPVSTTGLRLTLNKTQVVDAQKRLYNLYVTAELGTFAGYPAHTPTFRHEQVKKHSIRGRDRFTMLDEQYVGKLAFQNYLSAADHALILATWEARQEFLIYPCGGNADQFRYPMKGNRLQDAYLVWFDGDFSPQYQQGVYQLGLSYTLTLAELT